MTHRCYKCNLNHKTMLLQLYDPCMRLFLISTWNDMFVWFDLMAHQHILGYIALKKSSLGGCISSMLIGCICKRKTIIERQSQDNFNKSLI